ncbi:disulfide bond formation protein DsbB [Ancylobacter sp. 3268]|uniref:disulfide bond formation protein B n=1 Tax=Ancylobacter sp. 3268 TaxID=2817752 RepID=UPI0028623D4C|nr:disulfide bond formation protein B [Ancylobacter sp. 3268]MDR6953888.1 disulfide bond formation protein DsbB [Ancylobacter sp. 3268]
MSTGTALLDPARSRLLNTFGLFAVAAVLLVAFLDQILYRDLPCPLCILQRVGFCGVGLGLVLNLRFGARPSHYAVAILSAMAGALVSVRQVLLHIVPGTGSYGDALLGLHFYSWALLLYVAVIGGCAVLLLFDRQFAMPSPDARPAGTLAMAALVLMAALTFGNGVSTVLECGAGLCSDDPAGYELLPARPATP